MYGCVCTRLYRYSNRGPVTIEDNRVHNWKACTKPMEVVPQKYKQKKDNRGSTTEGGYTLGCVCGPCV